MLHHRHQFHMGISHILYIISQLYSQFPVIIELRPGNHISIFILCKRFADPGAQMNFVDIKRLVLCIRSGPLFHPLLILPLIGSNIPHNGGIIGAQLCIVGIGITF